MIHRDLGTMDGPVLIFGGPYSNLQATEALLAQARHWAIGPAQMICTGDLVAYCGAPGETVALVRNTGCAVVAGNCEKQLAAGALDCGCGFEEGTACDLLSAGWYAYASAHVATDARAWMGELPDIASFTHQGARYAVIHGGVRDIARFIWSSSPPEIFEEEWQAVEEILGPVDHILAGHSGIPFQRGTPHGRWINAGVIGMPPHDGRQQTRYALLDGGEVQFHHLTYDVPAAVEDMRRAGLTQGYDRALRTGYWPSEDVLPGDLRLSALANG